MAVITLNTEIAAPIETVFDISRSIDLHVESTAQTNEKAVAGRTSGLIELGETVTWEASHFFVRQRLTVRISKLDRPHHFQDSMVSGVFTRFDHDHHFCSCKSGTLMTDVFDFTSPLGPLGRIADWLFVSRHMRKLLTVRNELIKSIAESGNAHRFVVGTQTVAAKTADNQAVNRRFKNRRAKWSVLSSYPVTFNVILLSESNGDN